MDHRRGTWTVRDWMRPNPVTIPSTATLPDAYWLMVENKIRRLLVVDDGQLVGIVTMEDLRGAIRPEIIAINPLKVNTIFSELPIHRLMSRDPITIPPTASVMEAAQTMLENRISTLPVVESGTAVGIITESDLFRVLVDLCRAREAQGNEAENRQPPEAAG